MVIEVPYDVLTTGNYIGCRGCGIEFNVDKNGQTAKKKQEPARSPEKTQKTSRARSNPAPQKIQTNKSKRKTLTNVKIGTVKTVRKRSSRKSKADQQTQYFIKLAVGGLAAILAVVLIAKFATGSSKQPVQVAESLSEESNNDVKDALALPVKAVKKMSGAGGKASALVPAGSASVPTSSEAKNAPEVVVQNVAFAQAPQTDVAADQPAGDFSVKPITPRTIPAKESEKVTETVKRTVRKSPMILIASEENEMNELRKLDRRDMTQEEKTRVDYLMNKYNWYKSMRYKYSSREEMDRRWEQRHEAIEATNKIVASRRDSMLTRPLQILLEGITDPKQRAYLMRIYQKPVSFKEKEMVRKARAQAAWERRRADGPMRYPEDRRKKRGRDQIYTDEYGYKYYVDERGNRVYVDDEDEK
jgi:hypothetical protein